MKCKKINKKSELLKLKKEINGITLIALVVTIIVLLILSAIAINLTIGNNGIIKRAQDSTQKREEATANEQNELNEVANFMDKYLNDNDDSEDNEDNPILTEVKLGDYINYDAGIWTKEEIDELKSQNMYVDGSLPTIEEAFKFGGFTENQSRNKSIDAYENSNITQNPDFSEGWRVLAINEDGSLKIVSAGTVEAFRHSQYSPMDGFYSGYYCEYILRKVVNENDTDHTEEDYINAGIVPRDFSMYENELAKNNSAHCMSIYDAYNITGSLESTTNKLRNLGIFYHLASGQGKTALARVQPNGDIFASENTCYGIRIVLDLKPEVVIASDNTGDGTSFEKAWKLSLK